MYEQFLSVPYATHATVGGSSPASTTSSRRYPEDLAESGIPESPASSDAGVSIFRNNERAAALSGGGRPREGVQVHIAKPIGDETHTRLLDSLRSVISPFFDRRLSVTDRGRSLPVCKKQRDISSEN